VHYTGARRIGAASISLETRSGINGQPLINVVAYDALRGQRAPRRGAPRVGPKPIPKVPRPDAPIETAVGGDYPDRAESLHQAQARKTSRQVDLAALALQEKRGTLVPVEEVADAMRRCADVIVRSL
jgi:hypothetical protein